ncbi:MAG: patatin-like phospholipase family protein [Xanthobacteraceae bacterium]
MRFAAMILCAAALGGCATIRNEPINVPLAADVVAVDASRGIPTGGDDLLIGLAFSGGGTRAAAFSYGVLSELDRTEAGSAGQNASLFDRVDYISGVSGGAVTAAYFGLKGRGALSDFRELFLLRDAEESLRTPFAPASVIRAYKGGVNDAEQFPRWLDENLFRGATFRELNSAHRPRVLINASDVYNRTPFVFNDTTFKAICSDLNSYPIASAVAASAAIPVVFAPIVLTSYGNRCQATIPEWIAAAKSNAAAPPLLKALASAMSRYRDGSVPYIKLLDGGLVDNYGLSGFTIARLSADTPYGPLTAQQAVKIRRVLFLVVDAGRGPSGEWAQSLEGPTALEIVRAAADTAIDSSARSSFTAFDRTMTEWRDALVRWRCSLSSADRQRYGVASRSDCHDLKFFVGRINFEQLGAQRASALNSIPTRFRLSQEQVGTLIAAGQDALRTNAMFHAFLKSIGGKLLTAASSAIQ